MGHTFILSDESLNEYGFRILTDGIDIEQFKRNPVMLYMHQRGTFSANGSEVIGRWENIRKENGKLLADAVFDESDPFAKKIAEKVKNGFIRMASVGIKPVEISDDKKYLLPGQTRATVVKSKLREASIVDIGGNDNAIRLYGENGDFDIEQLNLKTDTMELKAIATALGLGAQADTEQVLESIRELKFAKEEAEKQLAEMRKAQEEARKKEAKALLDKAKSLKLLDENQIRAYEKLFEADHENAKEVLSALLEKQETPKENPVGEFIKQMGKGGSAEPKKDYRWYEENDPGYLLKLKRDNPDEFQRLFDEYYNPEQ